VESALHASSLPSPNGFARCVARQATLGRIAIQRVAAGGSTWPLLLGIGEDAAVDARRLPGVPVAHEAGAVL
jgi:hypothetical protein